MLVNYLVTFRNTFDNVNKHISQHPAVYQDGAFTKDFLLPSMNIAFYT